MYVSPVPELSVHLLDNITSIAADDIIHLFLKHMHSLEKKITEGILLYHGEMEIRFFNIPCMKELLSKPICLLACIMSTHIHWGFVRQ